MKLRQQEVELQCADFNLRRQRVLAEEKESEARMNECTARSMKLREEAQHWRLQARITLLRERKKLITKEYRKMISICCFH